MCLFSKVLSLPCLVVDIEIVQVLENIYRNLINWQDLIENTQFQGYDRGSEIFTNTETCEFKNKD